MAVYKSMSSGLKYSIAGSLVIVMLILSGITISWYFEKEHSSLYRDSVKIAEHRWAVEAERTYINKNSWYRRNVMCPRIISEGGYETATRCYYPDDYYESLSRNLIGTKIDTILDVGLSVVRLTPFYQYGTAGAHAGILNETFYFVPTSSELEFPKDYNVNWDPKDTRNYKLVWRVEKLKGIKLPVGEYRHCKYTADFVKIDIIDCDKLEKAVVYDNKIWFYFNSKRGEQSLNVLLVDPSPTIYTTASANSAAWNKYVVPYPANAEDGDVTSEANLAKMDADDDTSFAVNGGADYTFQTVKFRIVEAEGDITQLDLHIDGFTQSNAGTWNRIYCFNDETSTWDSIEDISDSATETDYDTSIGTNMGDYINADGDIYWRAIVYVVNPVAAVSIDHIYMTVAYEEGLLPAVVYVAPTETDYTNVTIDSTIINVSINLTTLDMVNFTWNGTTYDLFDEQVVLLMNFDNVSALGETDAVILDVSGYGNNGTNIGSTIMNMTGGKYGGAFEFDGIDDYINISTSPIVSGDQVTISAWVNMKGYSPTGQSSIAVDGLSGGNRNWQFAVHPDDSDPHKVHLAIWTNASAVYYNLTDTDVPLNQWTYLTGVYNGTDVFMYFNGERDGGTTPVTGNIFADSLDISIGSLGGGSNTWFNGTIDEVRVWNRSLTAAEVQQQYVSNLYKYNTTEWILYLTQELFSGNQNTHQTCASDTAGNYDCTDLRNIGFDDETPPEINITYPANTSYVCDPDIINYTYVEDNLGYCWYSLDGGGVNSSTVVIGTNFTGLVPNETSNNLTLYCNDTSNNVNETSVTFEVGIKSCSPSLESNKRCQIATDFIDESTSRCILFNYTNKNITIEGNWHILDSNGVADRAIDSYIYSGDKNGNITIQNLTLTDWDTYTIYVYKSDGWTFRNINITNSKDNGIYLTYLDDSIFENITLTNIPDLPIRLYGCDNNTFENITITNTNDDGMYIASSKNVTIKDVLIEEASDRAIYLSSSMQPTIVNYTSINNRYGIYNYHADDMILTNSTIIGSTLRGVHLSYNRYGMIYNNLFNNSINVYTPLISLTYSGTYNISKTETTSIIGGSYVGGNAWFNPIGTGYSETCVDTDSDDICDVPYTIKIYHVDYLPLTTTVPDTTPPTIDFFNPRNNTFVNGDVTLKAQASDGIGVRDVNFTYSNASVDNIQLCVDDLSPYRCAWNTDSFSNDTEGYIFNATACDDVGNCASDYNTYFIDRTIPLAQNLTITYPLFQSSARDTQEVVLRVNTTDSAEVAAGMNITFVDLSNLNGTGNLSMVLEDGSLANDEWSLWNLSTIIVGAATGIQEAFTYVYDNATPTNNLRESELFYVQIDNDIPTFSGLGDAPDPTYNNTEATFYVNAFDNYELDNYIFSSNVTGTWVNETPISISGVAYYCPFTKTIYTDYGGNYSYKFYVYDDAGNMGATTEGTIEVQGSAPEFTVYLNSPEDESALNTVEVNLTYFYTTGNATNCTLWINGTENETRAFPPPDIIQGVDVTLQDGDFDWEVECYDNETNSSAFSDSWNFTIDSTAPEITINLPTNITYDDSWIEFNVTLNEEGNCLYSLDGGTNNITMNKEGSIYFYHINDSIADEDYLASFYCNDTSNNLNDTESVWFGVFDAGEADVEYYINLSIGVMRLTNCSPDWEFYPTFPTGQTSVLPVLNATNNGTIAGDLQIKLTANAASGWTLFACNASTADPNSDDACLTLITSAQTIWNDVAIDEERPIWIYGNCSFVTSNPQASIDMQVA